MVCWLHPIKYGGRRSAKPKGYVSLHSNQRPPFNGYSGVKNVPTRHIEGLCESLLSPSIPRVHIMGSQPNAWPVATLIGERYVRI